MFGLLKLQFIHLHLWVKRSIFWMLEDVVTMFNHHGKPGFCDPISSHQDLSRYILHDTTLSFARVIISTRHTYNWWTCIFQEASLLPRLFHNSELKSVEHASKLDWLEDSLSVQRCETTLGILNKQDNCLYEPLLLSLLFPWLLLLFLISIQHQISSDVPLPFILMSFSHAWNVMGFIEEICNTRA